MVKETKIVFGIDDLVGIRVRCKKCGSETDVVPDCLLLTHYLIAVTIPRLEPSRRGIRVLNH